MARSRSIIAVPPGATIKEQLIDRGMSQKEFATRMDMSEKHISRLINGEVQLTSEMAVRLEVVLGISAKFWNRLEAMYREELVKVEAENLMDEDIEMVQHFPYNKMANLGWIPKTSYKTERVVNLRKYFEVVRLSLLNNRQINKINSSSTIVEGKCDFALLAWSQEVKLEARNIETSPINIKGLIEIIPNIKNMTTVSPNENYSELKNTLAKYGIALVLLPYLEKMKANGISFKDGKKIVIGLATENKTKTENNELWLELFRELGHIILGHTEGGEVITNQEEIDANIWAIAALKE